MNSLQANRREFFKFGAAAATATLMNPPLNTAMTKNPNDDLWRGMKIGVASYTFRSFSLDEAIKGIRRVGLRFISVKDMHLPLKSSPEERKAVAKKLRDAGIEPLSCGVIYLPKDEVGIRHAFDYARDLGAPTIVCSPDPTTLDLLDSLVKEYDVRLAIHNHGPGDKLFPTPEDVMKAIRGHDERIGLCIDIGHTLRAGVDPAKAILKCRNRLYDVHLKDETKAAATGSPTEAGRGVLDLKAVFDALLRINYAHLADFEYEKDGDDPLPGLAESVGYCKGLIAAHRLTRSNRS